MVDIHLVDIIAEILSQTLDPAPENPFALDHTYYDSLPLEESMLLSGAMVDFLQRLCLRKYGYTERVLEDLRKLQKRHFHEFDEVLAAQRRPLPDTTATDGERSAVTSAQSTDLPGSGGA